MDVTVTSQGVSVSACREEVNYKNRWLTGPGSMENRIEKSMVLRHSLATVGLQAV